LRIDAKLEDSGVAHKLITFPNSGHSLGNDPDKHREYLETLYQYAVAYLL
jgi:dipeptidyl aminopeptidase/acylaminoacyl peptidase